MEDDDMEYLEAAGSDEVASLRGPLRLLFLTVALGLWL